MHEVATTHRSYSGSHAGTTGSNDKDNSNSISRRRPIDIALILETRLQTPNRPDFRLDAAVSRDARATRVSWLRRYAADSVRFHGFREPGLNFARDPPAAQRLLGVSNN